MFALGTDLDGVEDIDPSMRTVSGRLGCAQAIARRFRTRRGSLWYAKTFGYDLRQHLNDVMPPVGAVTSSVEEEAEKDERVSRCRASVVFESETLTVILKLDAAFGPFELTLLVTKLTVEILQVR